MTGSTLNISEAYMTDDMKQLQVELALGGHRFLDCHDLEKTFGVLSHKCIGKVKCYYDRLTQMFYFFCETHKSLARMEYKIISSYEDVEI